MGQDLDVLKKLFNETLRAMMEELSKASPDSCGYHVVFSTHPATVLEF